jgi:hypothetical protein
MRALHSLGLSAVTAGLFLVGLPSARAQVSIDIGPAPVCPYGYYDVAPYNCAPAGYYGPEWFNGEVFIGAGPWFHGSSSFHGYVNNTYHPQYGYKGVFPNRGERADPAKRVSAANFRGNEMRDGHGNVVGGKR